MKTEYTTGGGWGNAINWQDPSEFDKWDGKEHTFRVVGWKRRRPQKGDTLRAEFEKSWITFRFVKVDLCRDPRDMFFGDVVPVSQEMKEDK